MYFNKKTGFLKRVKPRKPLYSCSRIRIAECVLKQDALDKYGKSIQNSHKIGVKQVMQKSMKKHPQINQKVSQKPSQNQLKMNVLFGPVPKLLFEPPRLLLGVNMSPY